MPSEERDNILGDDETEEEMRMRVEAEERDREVEEESAARPMGVPHGAAEVDLKTVAKRFGFLGMIAFGGPPAKGGNLLSALDISPSYH